jgi:hypothetical protein
MQLQGFSSIHFCRQNCCGGKWRCFGRTPWFGIVKETFSGWIRLALAPASRNRSRFAHHDRKQAAIFALRHYPDLSFIWITERFSARLITGDAAILLLSSLKNKWNDLPNSSNG